MFFLEMALTLLDQKVLIGKLNECQWIIDHNVRLAISNIRIAGKRIFLKLFKVPVKLF